MRNSDTHDGDRPGGGGHPGNGAKRPGHAQHSDDRQQASIVAAGACAGRRAPFERIDGDIGRGLVIVCDHAQNYIPPEYNLLGLPPAELERHIAYDIGVEGVARELARRLGVPAVLSCFSRLLIDPNRGVDDPTLIMRLSDGAIIPGNRSISVEERADRIARFHRPYHEAITSLLDACLAADTVPAIFSIHSFTPRWKGVPRPWDATILWDSDPRLVKPMLARLSAQNDLIAGENEPYRGELEGDCMYTHGTKRGLAHALIEIRQDHIAEELGQLAWAGRLAVMLEDILGDEGTRRDLGRIQHFGSRSQAARLAHRDRADMARRSVLA